MTAIETIARLGASVTRGLDALRPVLALAIRLWVARVFFLSGLTKIQSWDTTVALFTHEYQVPLLAPEPAALLAAGVELLFPVLLALGLGTRASAALLFVFNALAVVSYPELGEAGLKDHFYWGALLLVTLLYGPGKLSLDCLLCRRWCPSARS
jgi:putative oxidoreductase